MQKILKHCAAVARGVIFIGFGIQIVLGILWMCNAFAGLHSPGRGIVCVGEIAALSAAVCFVLGCGKRRKPVKVCFAVLSVLTFPMVMQCLAGADMRVFTAALLLSECGCVLRAVSDSGQGKQWRFAALACGCWLAAGLLRGEYLFLGMLPMLFYMLSSVRREQVLRRAFLVLATAGLTAGIGSFYRSPADVMTIVTDRVAWTTLYSDYEGLSRERRDPMNYQELTESTYEASGVEEILVPSLVETFGEQEARVVMKELCAVAWRENRSRIVKEIVWDLAGYTVPAAVVPLQLRGRAYDSYTGINYRQLLQAAPRLGKYYMDYGCWWFVSALVLRVLVWLLEERRAERRSLLVFGVTAMFSALWYTMSGAGKMDYKNTLFLLCVWLLWLVPGAALDERADGEESV